MKADIILLAAFSSCLVAISQVLLKIGANRFSQDNLLRQYLNVFVITAYFLFGLITIINVHIFSTLPLNVSSLMIALSYILIAFTSRFFLKEEISRKRIVGLFLTFFGMIIYGLGI